jgi:hypothetical protein
VFVWCVFQYRQLRLTRGIAQLFQYICVWIFRRTMMVVGGVDPEGNFTATVETLDVTAATPQW